MPPADSSEGKEGNSMKVFALTDKGMYRETNEDAYYINQEELAFAVADGMGGHNAGDVASRIVTDRLADIDFISTESLKEAFISINSDIYVESASNKDYQGMGTTLTLLRIRDRVAQICHIGDSRAYLIRGGTIKQLTTDHTIVNELLKIEEITAEQAHEHPYQNVLSRALGVEKQIHPEDIKLELEAGDSLLLSTDGLHGFVPAESIQDVFLSKQGHAEAIAKELIRLAFEQGGKDNVTVVVITDLFNRE